MYAKQALSVSSSCRGCIFCNKVSVIILVARKLFVLRARPGHPMTYPSFSGIHIAAQVPLAFCCERERLIPQSHFFGAATHLLLHQMEYNPMLELSCGIRKPNASFRDHSLLLESWYGHESRTLFPLAPGFPISWRTVLTLLRIGYKHHLHTDLLSTFFSLLRVCACVCVCVCVCVCLYLCTLSVYIHYCVHCKIFRLQCINKPRTTVTIVFSCLACLLLASFLLRQKTP